MVPRPLFITILICLTFLVTQAQESQLTPPAKRKFKYDGKIETTYDPARDQSMVFFKLIPIKQLEEPKDMHEVQFSDERMELTAYFAYPGQTLITPKWVTIGFLSYTENPQKYKDHRLSVKVDGQWVELGTMKVLSKVTYERRIRLPLVQQTSELPVPYQQFLLLANAKKVKVKLGSEEFDLEKKHLEAIRDLAAHTVP